MILICARVGCGMEKYANHKAEPPHPGIKSPPCDGYLPGWPCLACGQDCELHEVEEPHPAPDFDCLAAEPGRPSGGGSFGGGGASGGW